MLARAYNSYVGVIRRVVRQDGNHVCGICRRSYSNMGEAYGCLEQCFREFLALPPVVQRQQGQRVNFRCRVCARDYATYAAAETCAKDCRREIEKRYAAERAVLGMVPEIEVRKRSAGRRPVIIQPLAPALPFKRKAENAPATNNDNSESVEIEAIPAGEALAPATAAPAAAPTALAPAPAAGAAPETAPQEEVKKPKPNKKWIRDGAEYVCTICQGRYYTRVETEQCFEKHD